MTPKAHRASAVWAEVQARQFGARPGEYWTQRYLEARDRARYHRNRAREIEQREER